MHDGVAAGHNAFQQRRIADIADDKFDLRLRQPVDVRRIARIRQLVKHGDVHVRMIARHVPYEIRADEPASTRHQNMFRFESLFAHCFSNRLPDSNITNANKGA